MIYTKLIGSFALFGICLMLCGTVHAASQFQVTPSALTFGDVKLGQSKTLSFTVVNLQATPLQVTLKASTAFYTIHPVGQSPVTCGGCPITLTLGPKESKEVQVIFPGNPLCDQVGSTITVTAGAEQESVSLSAKLICPELQFVGTGPTVSLQGNNIKTNFSVINTGTIQSIACAGQIALDGVVAQSFDIPAFSTDPPNDQKHFELLIPASAGSHTVEVRIDTNNLNREAKEDANNKASRTITVPPPPTPPPPPPPAPVTITVTKSGSGTGTVTDSAGMNCGADCSSSVSPGTIITLKALPSSGSTFRSWSNATGSATACNNSTTAICRFTLSQNSAIRANFELAQ